MDRRLRGILILWRQHTFLTLAGVEPINLSISTDELPSAAICRTRRRLSGVNRTGRLIFVVMGHLHQVSREQDLILHCVHAAAILRSSEPQLWCALWSERRSQP